ncbi:MAG: polyphosphate kinase 1 [Prolixibacteraceae bacterium]|jgi:polyphosphate kinase|nr:polyphosphate kinase 1 [Prolixibacteraceae bacterium]
MSNYSYFNRDLSWLTFNHRVLEEAKDKSIPLYERIKFLAIYSNNLEEFYQVRYSYYRQLLENEHLIPNKIAAVNPSKILQQINKTVTQFQLEFHQIFDNEIIPELKKNNIILLNKNSKLSDEQTVEIEKIFDAEVLSLLQPVLIVKKRIRPFLKTGQGYIAMELVIKESKVGVLKKARKRYGMIKVPTDHNLSRFIQLEPSNGKHYIMFLEDLIMCHINKIFPGYIVKNWYSIKLTRDADMDYDEFEEEDLIDAIEKISSSRSLGEANRFLYDRSMPENVLSYFMKAFKIESDILVKGGTYHNFRDFFRFPNPISPQLENVKLQPLRIPELDEVNLLKTAINKKDYLLSVPYQTYDYFIKFLEQAAQDETVTEIKTTQYRVANRSAVVNALIAAAENGKKVTVFVELKARFDEEANLRYAAEMTKAGISIFYSIPGLKVHAKAALIKRDSKKYEGEKDQAYIATGNFNENTAKLYSDHGLFTSHKEIISDLHSLFNYLQDQNQKIKFKHLLIPNFNLISNFGKLICREMENVKKGKKGHITLKMNGLQDPHMVNLLYRASEAGVKIDLIIRGICILKTGHDYSRNIRVIRIIDRFLEHARVFIFHNNGDESVYLGSADWMKRNLYRRVECIFPVYEKALKQEVIDVIRIQLADNVKACEIGSNMENNRIPTTEPKIQSQLHTYEYFKNKYIK